MLPIVVTAVKDESWRVRWAVANKFCDLCAVVSSGSPSEQLLECYVGLLGDVEAEVRAAAAHKLLDVAKTLTPESILAKVVTCPRLLACGVLPLNEFCPIPPRSCPPSINWSKMTTNTFA